jgi:Protein of unknown function (DUF2971)
MGQLTQRLLAQPPPGTLYHYTTQAGLMSILKARALWASKMQYLNDASEFLHGLAIGKKVLEEQLNAHRSAERAAVLNNIKRALDQLSWTHVFVGSLSAAGDLLSQWRGYCPDANGFSIGFNVERLSIALSEQGFRLAPCVYKEEDQLLLLNELFDDALGFSNTYSGDIFSPQLNPGLAKLSRFLGPQASFFVREFLNLGSLYKHESFSEEREWRILCGVIPHTHPDFRIRTGKSMLIPYREIKLCATGGPIFIDELIVGPTPHHDLARQSAKNLVDSLPPIKTIRVRLSSVPYRSW